MKIIKYQENENKYVLVYKTKIFIYYLFIINNNPYYYERYNSKNYNKTLKICKRFLKTNQLKISSSDYDNYELAYKCDSFAYKKSDYHLSSETYGNDKGVTFCVYKDGIKKEEFKGQKRSSTFITSYILTKFHFPFPPQYYIYCDLLMPFINETEIKKINRYCKILFLKFLNYEFEDIKVNFEHLCHTNQFYYINKIFSDYDQKIKIDVKKIIHKFNLENNFNKKAAFIYYSTTYFGILFFKDYIKKNNIQNSKIIINCCIFGGQYFSKYFNDSNQYIFSEYNSLRNGWMFFIDQKYNDYLKIIKENKRKEKIQKHIQKIIEQNK